MALLAHVADTHIAATGRLGRDPETGLDRDMLERAKALRWCATDARQQGAGVLIHCGDLFHSPRPTPTEWQLTFEAFADWFVLPAQYPTQTRVHILVGNHDLAKGAQETSAPRMVMGRGVVVHEHPSLEAAMGFDLAVLPYPNKQLLLAARPDLGTIAIEQAMSQAVMDVLRGLAVQRRDGVPMILAAHIPLGLARLSSEREMDPFGMDWSVNPHDLEGLFDLCLLGHYHVPQWPSETVCYAGSPMEFTFGDEDRDPDSRGRGYYLHDTETGESTFRAYPHGLRHLTVDLRSGNDWPDPEEAKDRIVRVLAAPDAEPRVLQEMVMGFGALTCRVDQQAHETVARREHALTEGMTAAEALAEWARLNDREVPGLMEAAAEVEEGMAP